MASPHVLLMREGRVVAAGPAGASRSPREPVGDVRPAAARSSGTATAGPPGREHAAPRGPLRYACGVSRRLRRDRSAGSRPRERSTGRLGACRGSRIMAGWPGSASALALGAHRDWRRVRLRLPDAGRRRPGRSPLAAGLGASPVVGAGRWSRWPWLAAGAAARPSRSIERRLTVPRTPPVAIGAAALLGRRRRVGSSATGDRRATVGVKLGRLRSWTARVAPSTARPRASTRATTVRVVASIDGATAIVVDPASPSRQRVTLGAAT